MFWEPNTPNMLYHIVSLVDPNDDDTNTEYQQFLRTTLFTRSENV